MFGSEQRLCDGERLEGQEGGAAQVGEEWREGDDCGKRAFNSVSTSVADSKRNVDEGLQRLGRSVDE